MASEKKIKLIWGDTRNIPTQYVNNLFITQMGNEFFLVFGEMSPVSELMAGQIPDQLEVKPVVKIALSAETMLRFTEVIVENVEKFKENMAKSEETSQ